MCFLGKLPTAMAVLCTGMKLLSIPFLPAGISPVFQSKYLYALCKSRVDF
jgi:hypothetical protein